MSDPVTSPRRSPRSLFADVPTPSPLLSPDALREIAHIALDASSADVMSVLVHHLASGVTRVAENHVRLTNSGDTLTIHVNTRFGGRSGTEIEFNQIDAGSIRAAVHYAERIAHEMDGDLALTPEVVPIRPRTYGPSTVWHDTTASALAEARETIVPTLLQPIQDSGLRAAAFVGVAAHAKLFASKQGMMMVGQETDAELTLTAWSPSDGSALGSPAWTGQAARDWTVLDPTKVGTEAVRLATLAANPVAYEPGRRLTILGRPAVAQMIRAIGQDYDAQATHMGYTPLTGFKIDQKVLDERIELSSDPNDPDGGYLPFDDSGFPLIKMPWLTGGRLSNLAYSAYYAARFGLTTSNDAPESLRLQATAGPLLTVDEMIAGAKEAVYVNRVSDIRILQWRSGLMTGVTQGGCFLVHNGKIEKSIKDFRFVESVYFFLNRLVAIGTPERTAMGYSPWYGDWPIAPTIVPPLMVRDFNFVSLAEAI